ncbi:MAG: heme exporter protein CcmD [Pseudohongiellaceae bacterium]
MFEIQFSSLREFLQMGDYAFNVWSVYVLFALFFAINLFYPLLRRKQILREQKRRQFFQTTAPQGDTAIVGGTPSGPPGDTP